MNQPKRRAAPLPELRARLTKVAPEATVKLRRLGAGTIDIQLIHVPAHRRRMGDGTRVLDNLTDAADRHGWTLTLQPSSHLGTPLPALVAWYSRHGFTPVPNQAKHVMRRRPRI